LSQELAYETPVNMIVTTNTCAIVRVVVSIYRRIEVGSRGVEGDTRFNIDINLAFNRFGDGEN
jgi:hypothetical protein